MGERHSRDVGSPARDGLAALAIAVLAVGCCAGLPLLLVVASTVAVGTILGVAAGFVALAVLVGAAVWVRRRRGGQPCPGRHSRWRVRKDTWEVGQ